MGRVVQIRAMFMCVSITKNQTNIVLFEHVMLCLYPRTRNLDVNPPMSITQWGANSYRLNNLD